MGTKFVKVLCNVDCAWAEVPPRYRIFVNDELFTERTWIWREHYLEEMIQIDAKPGKYTVRFELLDLNISSLRVSSIRIGYGNAKVLNRHTLEILE